MTSPLATNAVSSINHFLEADKEGLPLQGQVGRTVEIYTDTGNETVNPLGKNTFIVENNLSAGDLTIAFTEDQVERDFVGREIKFIITAAAVGTNDVIFDLPAGVNFSSTIVAWGGNNTVTIGAATCVRIEFYSNGIVQVD